MKRFLRKALHGLVILIATLGVLALLFYAEEDWRGARDWAACQRELAAKGESLDPRQLAPPGKPQDDLSKVPIFAEDYQQFRESQQTGYSKTDPRLSHINANLNSGASPPSLSCYYPDKWGVDLSEWQKFYRGEWSGAHLPPKVGTPAQDVLQTLSRFDPEIKEIDAAISNPNAYWPRDNYVGAMIKLYSVAHVIRLKAAAQIAEHRPDLAEQSFLSSARIGEVLKGNSIFFPDFQLASEAILWEGLHSHAWTAPQLREMEESFGSSDILSQSLKDLRLDRAENLEAMDICQKSPGKMLEAVRNSESPVLDIAYITSSFRPRGWWNQDRCAYCRGVQTRLEAIDPARGILNPAAFPPHLPHEYWELPPDISTWKLIYTPLSANSLNGLDWEGIRIAKAETYRRLARLSCRLEEFRIAQGQYPNQLSDLLDLPPHLNQEVLGIQPFHYQRKGDSYSLYSVGWNQKDDSGKFAADLRKGDWPWPSP